MEMAAPGIAGVKQDLPAPAGRSDVERIKESSNYLRGSIERSLADPITGALADSDTQLIKFHGSYQQDDRDQRDERRRKKLEPLYSFMVRVRVPGGVCTPAQWRVLDELSRTHANGSLRLTTRQSFQFHGIPKPGLKDTIGAVNRALLSTIAACGDVNRNVMCNPNPYQSDLHAEVYDWATRITGRLTPNTRAYHEIWLDGERVAGGEPDHEPIYGAAYLPRKFKVAIAVPPSNDVDVLGHDLGFIAIVEDGKLAGFDVSVGGGLGMSHSEPATYPRLADVIGFCRPGQVVDVAEQVVAIQRDHGDRSDRKHARLKYTIDDRGVDWFRQALDARLGWALEPTRPYRFEHNGDRYGWTEGPQGMSHFTLFIENGRVNDSPDRPLMTGLREIAKVHDGDFRLTANQNLIIAKVSARNRATVEALLERYALGRMHERSAMRINSMACVALPTCGLAMAESERYLPSLLVHLERIAADCGLASEPITVRMTGCPNGCARPYLAEIAFVGKSPGRYNVYLGAGFAGDRLNKLYRSGLTEPEILDELAPILRRYAQERQSGERFGDFVIRAGYVAAVKAGREFHD
jgi:sulfite reductase (NADPH) hemoprotein beta-component